MKEEQYSTNLNLKVDGSLAILNTLDNDSKYSYNIEHFAEKFGFAVDEILDWKAE